MAKSIALSAIFLLVTVITFAKTTTAVTNGGNWTTAGTWDNGVPASGDIINIPAGITVIVNSVVNLRGGATTIINVSGEISFDDPNDLIDLTFAAIRLNTGDGDAINVLSGGTITANDLIGGVIGFGTNPLLLYSPFISVSALGTLTSGGSFTPGPITGPLVVSNGVLPIVLIAFDATVESQSVVLTWATASEESNDYFTVERSTDGEQFESVKDIKGKGTSLQETQYSTLDPSPIIGRSYYRLRQTDFDGTHSFSNVVRVDFEPDIRPRLVVYPNPVEGPTLNVRVEGAKPNQDVTIVLYSAQGKALVSKNYKTDLSGKVRDEWKAGSVMAAGSYVIKAGPTRALTQKLVVR